MSIVQAILKELKRRKQTRWWLAKQTGLNVTALYKSLSTKSPHSLSGRNLQKIMKVLDLEIRPKE